MKLILLTVTLVMLSGSSYGEDLLPVLPDRPFQAVIFPAELAKSDRYLAGHFNEFWTPTVEQVALAEKRITDFFTTAPTNEALRPLQRKFSVRVRDESARFIRQYVGAVRNGRRIILCVANSVALANQLEHDGWRKHLVVWADAADDWQIDYNLADDTCQRFHFDEGY